MNGRKPAPPQDRLSDNNITSAANPSALPGSRAVSWWPVHLWVTARIRPLGEIPMAGTPAWCLLDDDDPRKEAAVLDFGQHHALRVETAQEQAAEASKAVAAAADWPAVAREVLELADARRSGVRIEREVGR